MFTISLHHANHVRRYSVSAVRPSGWDIALVEDRQLKRLDHYDDWHRVERALAVFKLEVSRLTAQGWRVGGDEPLAGAGRS